MFKIRIFDKVVEVPPGAVAKDALELAGIFDKTTLAVLINNRLFGLHHPLERDSTMAPVKLNSDDGYRVYKQTLLCVFIQAVKQMFPQWEMEIHQSVTKSTYCHFVGDIVINNSVVDKIKEKMRQMIDDDLPLKMIKLTRREAKERFNAMNQPDYAKRVMSHPSDVLRFFEYDGGISFMYSVIAPSCSYVTEFELALFENGVLLLYPNINTKAKHLPHFRPSKKLFETVEDYRKWAEIIEVPTVYDLNYHITHGNIGEKIALSEIMHERKIASIADDIKNDFVNKRIVLITGPTSSGKTTFAYRLSLHLKALGIYPTIISLDDYFIDSDKTPLDEDGEHNFEDLEALDHELFNNHLAALVAGETVSMPKFDFDNGKSIKNARNVSLAKNEVLIIEGIHALNPKLSHSVARKNKFTIYVAALTVLAFDRYNPISPTDTRLIRRLIRDFNFRGASSIETLARWNSVQRGEIKNLLPVEDVADAFFNSSLVYEFSAYKPIAEVLLGRIEKGGPFYSDAERLLDFFKYFRPLSKKSVPQSSIIREFIGN